MSLDWASWKKAEAGEPRRITREELERAIAAMDERADAFLCRQRHVQAYYDEEDGRRYVCMEPEKHRPAQKDG